MEKRQTSFVLRLLEYVSHAVSSENYFSFRDIEFRTGAHFHPFHVLAGLNADSSGDDVLNYPGAPPPEKFDIPNA